MGLGCGLWLRDAGRGTLRQAPGRRRTNDCGSETVTFKPAVPKSWLMATAGLMWTGVGVVLCRLAWVWLMAVERPEAELLGAAGIVGAVVVHFFGFSKIARRNIERLEQLSKKACFFAFQAWRSYLLIGFMIALGIILRHSGFPKPYLAVIYATIGGALFLSSFHYYRGLYRMLRNRGCEADTDDAD